MKTLASIGEHAAIQALTQKLGTHSLLRTGTGDDCAVVQIPGTDFDQVFTTDPIIEHIHFLPTDDPVLIGSKAVGRVLSDIAAMGAAPQWVLINVVAPPEQDFEIISKMYDGLIAMAQRFGATVIGGDLAKGSTLELHLFGTGTVPAGKALLRSGAQVEDLIYVTGPLGGSIHGKHLSFIPKITEGLFLRESEQVHAMMDISDGLATDLRHMLKQSNVGAELDLTLIPISEAADSVEHALFDGEDFELLLTVSPMHADTLCAAWKQAFNAELYHVGCITNNPNQLTLKRNDGTTQLLQEKAFEHFK